MMPLEPKRSVHPVIFINSLSNIVKNLIYLTAAHMSIYVTTLHSRFVCNVCPCDSNCKICWLDFVAATAYLWIFPVSYFSSFHFFLSLSLSPYINLTRRNIIFVSHSTCGLDFYCHIWCTCFLNYLYWISFCLFKLSSFEVNILGCLI